jgi:hypothetical protein
VTWGSMVSDIRMWTLIDFVPGADGDSTKLKLARHHDVSNDVGKGHVTGNEECLSETRFPATSAHNLGGEWSVMPCESQAIRLVIENCWMTDAKTSAFCFFLLLDVRSFQNTLAHLIGFQPRQSLRVKLLP